MNATVPDEILLRRFAEKGDEGAFSEIVRRHAAMVFATCRRILGDPARAEDVSQETFLRLMRKPEAVTQSLAGWLYRAASQLAIDVIRSESARRSREAEYAAQEQREAPGWKEISPHVDEALMELDEESRMLLVRHFLEGKAQRELAEEMGVSVSTISRHLSQALDALRRGLGRKGIVIAAAILAECMALDSAEAAPVSLITELGKMAMVSGRCGRVIDYHTPVRPPSWGQTVIGKMSSGVMITMLAGLGALIVGWLFMTVLENRPKTPLIIVRPVVVEGRK